MDLSRRLFCGAGVGVLSSPLLIGANSAQNAITVTGQLTSQADADVSGLEFYLSNVETIDSARITLDSSGDISTTISEPGTFRVTVFDFSPESNKLPAVYSFPDIEISEDGTIGEFTLPEAYQVDIRCLDTQGNPIENLLVNFRAPNGTVMSPGTFTTTAEGYVKYTSADQPGVELVGEVEVEVQSASSGERQSLGTVDATEAAEFELVVDSTDKYKSNYKIIDADPDAGFDYPYLLYQPDVSKTFERPLYVQPHNAPPVTSRQELINQLISSFRGPLFAGARENGYPGIIPGFPRTPNDGPDTIQSLALPTYRPELLFENYKLEDIATEAFPADTLTRVDSQLLAMIEDARSRLMSEPYPVADRLHMSGFSASATFSSRFAFLYPTKVRTLTLGGHTLLPLPKDSDEDISLPYPLGTADYEVFTGSAFDMEAWSDINQYIYVGEEDQPLPDTDSRGYYNTIRYQDKAETVFGINRVTERLPFVKSQYIAATDNAEFEIFGGIGHSIDKRMEDAIVEFHNQNSPGKQVTISNVEIDPNTVSTSQTHVLTFDVANLSADAGKDNFTISLPNSINVDNVTIRDSGGLDPMPDDPAPENPIRFTVNPTSSIQSQIKMTVDLELSSRSN